jgi:hypothetical protein
VHESLFTHLVLCHDILGRVALLALYGSTSEVLPCLYGFFKASAAVLYSADPSGQAHNLLAVGIGYVQDRSQVVFHSSLEELSNKGIGALA